MAVDSLHFIIYCFNKIEIETHEKSGFLCEFSNHGGTNQNFSQLECPKMYYTFLKCTWSELLKKPKMKIPSSSPLPLLDTQNLGLKYENCQNQLIFSSKFNIGTLNNYAKFQLNRVTQFRAIPK